MTSKDLNKEVIELKELQRMADELTAEIEAIKDILKKELQDRGSEEVDTGTFIIRYKAIKSNRFDSKAFQKAEPEMYEAYKKESESMRFSIQ